MVAFTKVYNRRGGSAAKFPVQSTNNKAVKKAYKPKPKITKVNRNKSAIMTLSRQVKTLQNQRLGEIQSHTQHVALTGDNKPLSARPICFGLNNFYDQEIYYGQVGSGIATYGVAGTFTRTTFKSDLDDEYEWNARRNTDTVSVVEYKPVFTRLNMSFLFNQNSGVYPAKVRVTILKVKPYVASTKLNVHLPSALGAYRYLASRPGDVNRNYFDKTYHTILQDKWITISKPTADYGSNQFTKECRIDYKYGNEVLRPDITSTPAGQTFWTNTQQNEQIWVLISTNTDSFIHSVQISKFDVWRDGHGI